MTHASRRTHHATWLAIVVLALSACTAPTPIPTLVASPIPAVTPSLIPASAPTLTPEPPIPDPALFPALDRTLELGTRGPTDYWQLTHPLALDETQHRLYVSTSVSKTMVLDAETLTPIGEIQAGGSVAVLPQRDKLYIGTPGAYGPDGVIAVRPAMHVYDASTLAFRRSVVFSDTSSLPPLAVPDPQTGRVYVVHQGVYIADADALDITGYLSGTLPLPGALGYNFTAVDAALDAARQRLYVALNNGIPGSNNGTVYSVFDTASHQVIYQDGERGVFDFAVDAAAGATVVARSHLAGPALLQIDTQGKVRQQVDNLAGQVQVDAPHDRVYVLSTYPPRLVVLDRAFNYLGETAEAALANTIDFVIDAARDRLYALAGDGQLHVYRGHARSLQAQPQRPAPPRGSVHWIAPAPDFAADPLVLASFAIDHYASPGGTLFSSRDGQTWDFVAGLPVTNTVLALAFSPDFAVDRTLWAGLNGSGVYVSTDGGRAWSPAARGLTDLAINRIVVSPDFTHDHTLYATGQTRGLYVSTDGGTSWQPLADRYASTPDEARYQALNALALSPDFARDRSLLMSRISGTGGTFLSRDGGQTWRKVLADTATRLAYLGDGLRVYAVLGTGGVLFSADGGERWTAASEGLELSGGSLTDLLTSTDLALAWFNVYGQPARLYSRPDPRLPWQAVGDTQILGQTFALTADGTLFTGTLDGQVLRYAVQDLAVNSPAVRRVPDLQVQSLAIARDSSNEVYLGGGAFGVWATRDLDNWFDLAFPDRHAYEAVDLIVSPDFVHDQTIFASAGQGLYRSRGRPWRWEALNIGSNLLPIGAVAISPDFAADRTVLAAGDYRQPEVWASADGGEAWTRVAPPVVFTQAVSMRPLITPDGAWWLWVDYYGLYRSTDRGQAWTTALQDGNALATALAISPNYRQDGTLWIALVYGSIWRTRDAGRTWATVPSVVGDTSVVRALAFSPAFEADRTVFIGTDNGLYRSRDDGATWQPIGRGLTMSPGGGWQITALAISPAFATDGTLLAATSGGGLSISRDAGDTWVAVDQ